MKSLTDEQAAAVGSGARVNIVEARAGTGKTSMLDALARARPSARFLYVCFNRSVREEAEVRFPANVRAVTGHGLAFPGFGSKYQHKLVASLRPTHVADALDLSRMVAPDSVALFATRVIETLQRFLCSPAAELSVEMVSMGKAPIESGFGTQQILDCATRLWGMMCDAQNAEVGMLHDGYLKLYQLSRPALRADIVLFDEAQDANPVMLDMVGRHGGGQFYVGDPHQSIYAFRGAMDALSAARDAHPDRADFYLTGSFRFGPEIASAANAVLARKGERVLLSGLGKPGMVMASAAHEGRHAFISRGNAALFNKAVAVMREGDRLHLLGGVSRYRFDQLIDVHNIMYRGEVRDPFYRAFGSFDELEAYGEACEDREILSRCAVVRSHGRQVPSLVSAIERAQTESPADARVVLSTAHMSKGLEFDDVVLATDFAKPYDDDGSQAKIDAEEANILYVAMTRARVSLRLGEQLLKLSRERPGGFIRRKTQRSG